MGNPLEYGVVFRYNKVKGVISVSKNISSKDARALIQAHEQFLRDLSSVAGLAAAYRTELFRVLQSMLSRDSFSRIISRSLSQNSPVITPTSEISDVVKALYFCKSSQSLSDFAQQFYQLHSKSIQQNIRILRENTRGLLRFFASERRKESASAAYLELTEMRTGPYGLTVASLVSDIERLKQTKADEIWQDYQDHPGEYNSLYQKLVLRNQFPPRPVRPFHNLTREFTDLQSSIAACPDLCDKDAEEIKNAAQKLIATDALRILEDIPVEEISRKRKGIRVKTLMDNGYFTIADLHAASVFQLSSISGISEDAAYTIKRVVGQIAQEAGTGIKVKLSADNQTPASTALVTAVYRYKRRLNRIQNLHALTDGIIAQSKHADSVFSQVGNGAPWLFFTDDERQTVCDTYHSLSQALNSEDMHQARRLLLQVRKAEQYSPDDVWRDFSKDSIAYYNILEKIVPGILGNDDQLYGLPEELAQQIQDQAFFPDGLTCTLRRYQEWGVKYILHPEKVLLGDEMGLGKTVQAIAAMVSLRNTGATHFVVVCPASVVTNWCREITKHSKLRAIKVHGSGRISAWNSWKKTGGVAVTTYETTGYLQLSDSEHIDMLTVDEAHYIKNPEARRTIHVKVLCRHASRLLFMTGTALENKVDEMIALISMLQPSVASAVSHMAILSSAPQFRELVAPVYYRRKRTDVLTELPELMESKEWCTLGASEKDIYESTVLSRNFAAMRRVSWNAGDLQHSCKAVRLLELVEEAAAEDRKIIVFSFFLDTIHAIGGLLGECCYGPINGSVPPQRRQQILDEFANAPAGSVLLAQIQSGGTGLNIQCASVVILCEPQLKPSIENQAISRAYRMGQSRNVLVYRLLCDNTVDERITDLLEQKQAIFDAFADKSVAAEQSIDLDEKSTGQIIQEEIDRILATRPTAT